MLTSNHIKTIFIDYFTEKGFINCPPSSLVPPNDDASLLFTNSGMCQFKPIFLGLEQCQHQNVCNIQPCIRAGGKHNDLIDIGKDTYHHSLFLMAGYWCFNQDPQSDYKERAIFYAFDLLTRVYKLDKNRLYVTYYAGDDDDLPADIETYNIWQKYIDPTHILPFEHDNFWSMNNTGPCGPSTEIFYDFVGDRDASKLVNKDDPTVVEIWNTVFMQYNKVSDDIYDLLPYCHIDVGVGVERLVAVLQNKMSNYDTDIFQPLFDKITSTFNITYSDEIAIAYRIVSDHLRAIIYSLNDDIIPGHTGNNYIISKLYRRACFYAYMYFKIPQGYLVNLASEFINILINENSEFATKKNLMWYILSREEKEYGRVIWKSVTPFKKLLEKEDKIITSDEYIILTKSRNIHIDVIETFCNDYGFMIQ